MADYVVWRLSEDPDTVLDFILVRVIFVLVFGFAGAYFRPPPRQAALSGASYAVMAIFLERRFARARLKRTIGITIGVVSGLFQRGPGQRRTEPSGQR